MQDDLDNLEIRNTNYSLFKRLSPGVFTERNLYKNSNNEILLIKEPNIVFGKVLSSSQEATLASLREYRKLTHPNLVRIEEIITPQNLSTTLIASKFLKLNLFSLQNIQLINNDVVIYYFKQLLDLVDNLSDRSIYYYTLKIEDLFIDENLNLKIEEFGIGNAIINNSKIDLKTWVDKINIKSGTIAPEFFLNYEDRMEGHGNSVIFNLGYILFILIVGKPPFNKIDDNFYKLIIDRKEEDYWNIFDPNKLLDQNFKDLVYSMLNENIFERPNFHEILENKWLKDSHISESELSKEMNNLKEKMLNSKNVTPVVTIKKKTKFRNSNQIFKSIDYTINSEENKKEYSIKSQITEFLEAEQNQFLIEYVDYKEIGNSSGNHTIFFDNKFEEVVKLLVNYFDEEKYMVSFLYETILGMKFIKTNESNQSSENSESSESSESYLIKGLPESIFEIRFYEDKVKKNLAVEFLNISLSVEQFNQLYEEFLQILDKE